MADVITPRVWTNSGASGQEAAPGCVSIRNHYYLHPVVVGDQRSGPCRATEAPKPLAVNESVVHIHVVIAAKSVALQVKGMESEGHHFALRHLRTI